MVKIKINPTVRETNKYLKVTVDQLLEKHGKVSNPEFEKELIEITGIGWKQVKNYKNHPRPFQRLKDNSKILPFVLRKRSEDKSRKVKRWAGLALLGLTLITASYFSIRYITSPKYKIISFGSNEVSSVVKSKDIRFETSFNIPDKRWRVSLGKLSDTNIKIDKFSCKEKLNGRRQCQYQTDESALSIFLYLKDGLIFRYAITSLEISRPTNNAQILFKELKEKPFFNKESNKSQSLTEEITTINSETSSEQISYTYGRHGNKAKVDYLIIDVRVKNSPNE